MFAPLGFVPGITPPQVAAVGTPRRVGRRLACRLVEHFMKLGAWFAGTPAPAHRASEVARGAFPGHGAHQPEH